MSQISHLLIALCIVVPALEVVAQPAPAPLSAPAAEPEATPRAAPESRHR